MWGAYRCIIAFQFNTYSATASASLSATSYCCLCIWQRRTLCVCHERRGEVANVPYSNQLVAIVMKVHTAARKEATNSRCAASSASSRENDVSTT